MHVMPRYFFVVWCILVAITCSFFFRIVAAKIRFDDKRLQSQIYSSPSLVGLKPNLTHIESNDKRLNRSLNSAGVGDFPCPKVCKCEIHDKRYYTICNGDDTDDLVPKDIWNGTNVLVLEDFAIRKLRRSSPIYTLELLEELHASDIGLKQIEDGFFANLVNLKVLDFSRNNLRFVTPSNFSDIHSLRVLRLDGNKIERISTGSFDTLVNLSNLTLSHNYRFRTLPTDLFDLNKRLTYLTLHKNNIDFLPNNMFENNTALDYLTLPKHWHCNCSNIWLKEWLEDAGCPVQDIEDITCEGNGQSMVDTSIIYFKNQCNNHAKQTLPTIAAAIVFVLICVIVLHKRDLVLLTIYTTTGHRMCDRDKNRRDEGRPFDAFIVYARPDFDFAFNVLYKSLHPTYRVCLNEINFIPNVSIAENVINAVCSSKRIILVLSRDLILDEYCALAFTTAHQENMRDHVNRIIVIQMERINSAMLLDQDMKVYLSRTTKSKIWKDSRLFWPKLHYRMPDATQRSTDTQTSVHRSLILDFGSDHASQPLLTSETDDDFCILDPRYESQIVSTSDCYSSPETHSLEPPSDSERFPSMQREPCNVSDTLVSLGEVDSSPPSSLSNTKIPQFYDHTIPYLNPQKGQTIQIENSVSPEEPTTPEDRISNTLLKLQTTICSSGNHQLTIQQTVEAPHSTSNLDLAPHRTSNLDLAPHRTSNLDLHEAVETVWTPMSSCLLQWPHNQDDDTGEYNQDVTENCQESEDILNDDEMPTIKGKLTLLPLF